MSATICHCDGPPHPYVKSWCGRGKDYRGKPISDSMTPEMMARNMMNELNVSIDQKKLEELMRKYQSEAPYMPIQSPAKTGPYRAFPYPPKKTPLEKTQYDLYDFPEIGLQLEVNSDSTVNIAIRDKSHWATIDIQNSEYDDFLTVLQYLRMKVKG